MRLLVPLVFAAGCYGSYSLGGDDVGADDPRARRDAGVDGGRGRVDGGPGGRPGMPDLGRDLGGMRVDLSVGTPELATPYEACIEISRLICIGMATCCAESGAVPGPAVCEDPVFLNCERFLEDDRWTDGTIRYDPADARRAHQSYAEALATCGEVDIRWSDKMGIFRGTLPDGADCQFGDTTASHFSCQPGSRCVLLSPTEGICGALGRRGDRCGLSFECESGYFCDPAPLDTSHPSCQRLRALGESCSVSTACISGRCEGSCVEPTGPQTWCPPTGP